MIEGTKWEVVEDGYHKHIRLIKVSSGLILGEVSGCNCDAREPWEAFVEPPAKGGFIGKFVSERLARTALEKRLVTVLKKEEASAHD
jgi:hypothetical protein